MKCDTCGIIWCDSCRIFSDRVLEENLVSAAVKTHVWRCYGQKKIRHGEQEIRRKYFKCTKCKIFGLTRRVCRDTYPNDKVRWLSINGSILAPCSAQP